MIRKLTITLVVFAGLAVFPSWAQAQTEESPSASATLNEDGSLAISGIAQPGAGAILPAQCAAEADSVAKTVCAAEAFLATLDEAQKAQVLLPLASENATAWSNLPCGANCRVGILLSDLTEDQQDAALAVIMAATGDAAGSGFDEATQIMMADDILNASQASGEGGGPGAPGAPPDGMVPPAGTMGTPPAGGSPGSGGPGGGMGYSSGTYLIAFLGSPGTTETWQLQFGGHHLALLMTYVGGTQTGATPTFLGVEPKVWTDGTLVYAPLDDDRDALRAMLAGLSESQVEAARLDATFTDVVLGPGNDGAFPEVKAGLAVSQLDEAQKELVLEAIAAWVRDTPSVAADRIMYDYAAQLDETYIAFSGDISLSNHADYVRIDGPRVWIEFVCQNGVVYSSQIHYHTIWRDHQTDYGAVYRF